MDKIVFDKFVYIIFVDGYFVWVNMKVLEIVGIIVDMKDLNNGVIERRVDGRLIGILCEFVMSFVFKYIFVFFVEEKIEEI